ncbi:hypothetical protein [Nocardia sp. NPDC004604]|uniref:hypothetical protein n=1 Tax=unclassified Nocardia TaxID=2637762 RepID=UPI0033B0444D
MVRGKDFDAKHALGEVARHWQGLVHRDFGVNFDPMSSSRPTALRVTYVTAALGLRLPLTRELCCSCCS